MLPIKNKCTSEIICKNSIKKDLKWISQICFCILPVNICSVGSSKGIFWLKFDIPLVILQLFFYIHLRAISAILDNALVRISWLSTKPFQTFALVCFWTDLIKMGHSARDKHTRCGTTDNNYWCKCAKVNLIDISRNLSMFKSSYSLFYFVRFRAKIINT